MMVSLFHLIFRGFISAIQWHIRYCFRLVKRLFIGLAILRKGILLAEGYVEVVVDLFLDYIDALKGMEGLEQLAG